MAERIAQVDDQRLEVVGEAGGRPARSSSSTRAPIRLLPSARSGGLVERPPVGEPEALALALRQLREDVAQRVNRAALAVGLRPELLDRPDQARSAV